MRPKSIFRWRNQAEAVIIKDTYISQTTPKVDGLYDENENQLLNKAPYV